MNFKEKLKKLSEENKVHAQQLEENKRIWIQEVKKLYDIIKKEWFQEYIKEKHIAIDYRPLDFAECVEFMEEIRIMEINLAGGPSIFLEPTGINIAGAFGKIDLYQRGHKDEKLFLLLIENEEKPDARCWEVWESRKQQKYTHFDKEAFEKILDDWLEKWTTVK